MFSKDKKNSLIEIDSRVIEITDKNETECSFSKNVVKDPVNDTSDQRKLNDPIETTSKKRTSSDLLYSEYVKSEKPEQICGMFESKRKKPLIQSYRESPLYKQYSALLKELQESENVCPTACGEESPVVEIHCLVKQKEEEDNSEDSDCDIENSRLVFYDSKRETQSDSSDDETSSEDEETDVRNEAIS